LVPVAAIAALAASGRIGAVTRSFHGAPTNRSQRTTLDQDCPELLARCRADGADAAILVPNCPVCHQTLCLAARHLEMNGIATIVMGCAKDIVEHVGVPRFLFSDFPLGNGAGRPNDPDSQAFTLELALRVLESAPAPRKYRALAAALERGPLVEARLLQYRAPADGGTAAPATGISTVRKRSPRTSARSPRPCANPAREQMCRGCGASVGVEREVRPKTRDKNAEFAVLRRSCR
jgi:hypothetical protein